MTTATATATTINRAGSRPREIGAARSRGSPRRVPFPDGASIEIIRGKRAMRRKIRAGRPRGEFNDLTNPRKWRGSMVSNSGGEFSSVRLGARGPVASAVGRVLLSDRITVSPAAACPRGPAFHVVSRHCTARHHRRPFRRFADTRRDTRSTWSPHLLPFGGSTEKPDPLWIPDVNVININVINT